MFVVFEPKRFIFLLFASNIIRIGRKFSH
jgi:hypothetical protein